MRAARFSLSGCEENIFCTVEALAPLDSDQLVERIAHAVGAETVFHGELEAVFVGGILLFLRELRIGEGRYDLAQLRVAELGQRAAFGSSGGVARCGGEVGVFHRVFRVGVHHVADFMADDRHQFVVVHQVHQGCENPDRTVSAGESVDIHHEVDLEVERQAIDLGDAFGKPFEACAVTRRIVCHGVVGIHPLDRFAAQTGDVVVAERDGFGNVFAGAEEFSGIEFLTSDFKLGRSARRVCRNEECGCEQIEKFVHGVNYVWRRKDTNKPREKSKLACIFSEAEYLRRSQTYGKNG